MSILAVLGKVIARSIKRDEEEASLTGPAQGPAKTWTRRRTAR
jgi:hypothetical protein